MASVQATRRRGAVLNGIPVLRPGANRAPLGPLERRVLAAIDGLRTMDELADTLELTPREIAAVCARLCDLAVLELQSETSARRARMQGDLELDLDDDWQSAADTVRPSASKLAAGSGDEG